ncbi:hypothetical protein E5676_scaffold500G001160 [Cucumis melo var. makuwa]|uniref:Uncharacterized protein n=1 Tax=Cucumis melo var. makuwa TaxID=1194695 RepID=A0A5D3DIZ0_CUCMM|nr:hypothetical protein E6C27_scaffold30G001320 [Cucumis melo var. makuwa]TYK23604.1 hypothetical protein E5676_scaffold500G001160 [Cucumis melo var. makuwa]
MQQSIVDLTNLFTRIHVQPLGEAIQPPRNQAAANQEHPRDQAVHIHNNQLYGNNLSGYLLDDSNSSDEDNLLNIHQEPQRRLDFRPYFQEDQEIRMKNTRKFGWWPSSSKVALVLGGINFKITGGYLVNYLLEVKESDEIKKTKTYERTIGVNSNKELIPCTRLEIFNKEAHPHLQDPSRRMTFYPKIQPQNQNNQPSSSSFLDKEKSKKSSQITEIKESSLGTK